MEFADKEPDEQIRIDHARASSLQGAKLRGLPYQGISNTVLSLIGPCSRKHQAINSLCQITA